MILHVDVDKLIIDNISHVHLEHIILFFQCNSDFNIIFNISTDLSTNAFLDRKFQRVKNDFEQHN